MKGFGKGGKTITDKPWPAANAGKKTKFTGMLGGPSNGNTKGAPFAKKKSGRGR